MQARERRVCLFMEMCKSKQETKRRETFPVKVNGHAVVVPSGSESTSKTYIPLTLTSTCFLFQVVDAKRISVRK